MALRDYYLSVNRKDLVERAIVCRRNYDADKAQRIESAARYHRDLNFLSSQYKNLEEQQAGISRVNVESRLTEEAKVERREKLFERRQKLASLLAEEEQAYFIELQALAELDEAKDPWNISKLKEQITTLRQQREYDEEELRKRNKCHQQTNVPYVTEHKDELLGNAVKKAMEVKQKELQQEAFQKIAREKRRLQELQDFHEQAVKDLEVIMREREECRKKWEAIINERTKALTENSEDRELAVLEHEQLTSLHALIESYRTKREAVSKNHKETKKKISEFRCFKDRIIRMCAEMRHSLELDLVHLQQLESMGLRQKESLDISFDMSQVTAMVELITDMLDDEKQHEVKTYALFEEEAAKLWNQRKVVWNNDKWKSRDTLMDEVFGNLEIQIQNRLCAGLAVQDTLLAARETLLATLVDSREAFQEEDRELTDRVEYFQSKVHNLAKKTENFDATLPPPRLNLS